MRLDWSPVGERTGRQRNKAGNERVIGAVSQVGDLVGIALLIRFARKGAMEYRCILVDHAGAQVTTHEMTAPDDAAAIVQARTLYHPHRYVVRQGKRCVYPEAERAAKAALRT